MNSTGLQFFVSGLAKPAGSKKAFPLWRGKGPGRQFVRSLIVDASGQEGKNWRACVQAEARAAMGPGASLIDAPVRLTLTFIVLRPKSHSGARGLRPSAPAYPATKPDVLKLARAVEDALTGIVWRDDAQVVTEHLAKRYGENPGVHVLIKLEE